MGLRMLIRHQKDPRRSLASWLSPASSHVRRHSVGYRQRGIFLQQNTDTRIVLSSSSNRYIFNMGVLGLSSDKCLVLSLRTGGPVQNAQASWLRFVI